jgi:hypothetical protein
MALHSMKNITFQLFERTQCPSHGHRYPPPPGHGCTAVSGAGDLHGVRGPRGAAALQPLLRLQVLPLLTHPCPGKSPYNIKSLQYM